MLRTNSLLMKKTKRIIAGNWKQFFAIILITSLAVCLYSGLTANYKCLEKRVNQLYADGNMADIWVNVSEDNEEQYNNIESFNGIKQVYKRFLCSGYIGDKNVSGIITDSIPKINTYASLDGEEGFIIDGEFAKNNEIKIGDSVSFSIPVSFVKAVMRNHVSSDNELLNLYSFLKTSVKEGGVDYLDEEYISLEFIVTGTMMHPENIENGAFSTSYFITNYDSFYDSLFTVIDENYTSSSANQIKSMINDNPNLTNQYLITVTDKVNIGNIKEEIDSYLATKGSLVMSLDINHLPSNSVIQSDITQAKQLSLVFPIIFFLVAILVVLTTLSQIIIRERIQIGTMKAIGLSNKQILFHYLSLSVVLCLIGSAIGIIIGPILLPNVMNNKYSILYTLPSNSYVFPFLEVSLCVLVLIFFAVLITYLVCHEEISLTPAKSMRPATLPLQKKLVIEKIKGFDKVDIPAKMALRNIKFNITRSLMVVIGVLGCTALLVCGFGIDNTLNNGVDNDMNIVYSADVLLTYNSGVISCKDEILAVEGVDYLEEFAQIPATIIGDNAYSSNVYLLPDDSEFFKVPFQKDKIAISDKVAKEIGVKSKDKISFTVLGNTYSGEVDVVFDAFYAHGIYVNINQYPEITKVMTGAWVRVKSGFDVNSVSTKLDEIVSVNQSRTHQQIYDYIMNIIDSIKLMTFTVKLFAILLAVIVLYNLALLNFKERTRDIATLKVLGFNKFEIAKSLFIEILILTVLGIFFGLFLGMPLLRLVLSINETPIVAFLYKIYSSSYIDSILITLLTSLIINIILSNFTDKVKMVESLKSFE